MSDEKFIWIRTGDGSPTLWNNELGEPFRSTKGAFRESLLVFAKPALAYAKSRGLKEITVGEFGLGAGTNWYIFSCLAQHFELNLTYFAIEREIEPFNLGMHKWNDEFPLLQNLVEKEWDEPIDLSFNAADFPILFPSLEDVTANLKCDVWFHDPFGFAVNPDGYLLATLEKCSHHWKTEFLGLSYACNSQFQRDLTALGVPRVRTLELNAPPLKRERLEFSAP